MQTTMQLLTKALTVKRATRWCEDLNLNMSTISTARKRGRLSPTLAGNLAIELGESPEHWIAVAALEAEPESPLLQTLKTRSEQWQYSLFEPWRKRHALTTHRAPMRFFYVCI